MMHLLVLVFASITWAQEYFPDVPEYQTLICDFHMHTVFSDGLVWPTVRVDEAQREGIDVIALSDHIEYQPHKDDIPTNHNRPFAIAQENAKQKNVLLIKGAEITRDTPPGHYNALFLHDIDPLETPDFFDCHNAAKDQKAFTFWNHHTWKGVERGQWTETQDKMLMDGLLDGMEVANGKVYYPLAHAWCLERNLTMIGNSDIHHPSIDYEYTSQQHRTLTLVFAKECTEAAVKEALCSGRTVVWHNNTLMGRESYLKPLFEQCVTFAPVHYVDKKDNAYLEVSNNALVDFELKAMGKTKPGSVTIPAKSSIILKTNIKDQEGKSTLSYRVTNCLVAPEQGLSIKIKVAL